MAVKASIFVKDRESVEPSTQVFHEGVQRHNDNGGLLGLDENRNEYEHGLAPNFSGGDSDTSLIFKDGRILIGTSG